MPGPINQVGASGASAAVSETNTPGTPNAALPGFAEVAPGDVVANALMELSSFLRKMQDGQRSIRRAEEQARIDQERGEVQAMHDKASAIRSSAVVAGVALGAEAICTGVAAADAAPEMYWSKGVTETPAGQAWQGVAKIMDGCSTLANRMGDAAAADHEADATNSRAMADQAQSRAEDAKDRDKDLGELAGKALDAVRAVLQAEQAARMAIAGRV